MATLASAQDIHFVPYTGGAKTAAGNDAAKQGAALQQPGDDAKDWDYGTIAHQSTGYRYFKFTNTGDAPLVISGAKGSCGCTIPTYPKEPIMPGESGYLQVKYDTNRKGNFAKTVTLTTNAQSGGTTVLKIHGQVQTSPATPSTSSTPY